MILYPEKLAKCKKKVVALADYLETKAKKLGTDLIVTSGKRDGDGKSWHDKGLAIDFNFRNIHSFKLVSELFMEYLANKGAFEGATEFEVCCADHKTHHIHIAFGTEQVKEMFTGVYR